MEFSKRFISYSSNDVDFVRRLHGRMRDAHLRVWFAPEDMPGGKKLHEEIETAIRVYDKLLIVLSEAKRMGDDRTAQGAQSRATDRQTQALPRAPGGL